MKALLLPLSILCSKSTAQVNDLMRNKDITWIAESYNDFSTDEVLESVIGKRLNDVKTLKFTNNTEGVVSEKFALQQFILKAIKNNKLSVFKDFDCKEPMTYDETCKFDTLQSGNFKSVIVRNEIPVENIPFFRVRQVLFYDAKKIQFGLRTLAVAVMAKKYGENDNHTGWQPVFWIKITDLNEKRNLSDDTVTWAKRMDLHNGVALKADSVKILKQMGDSVPMKPLFQAFLTKPNIPFYRSDSMPMWVKHTFIEKQKIFIQRDTITCISLEPAFVIINRDIHHFDVVGLRLIQNWYWDDKKKKLEIYHVATAPLIDVKNEAGEFLFKLPLFYRRTDD